MQVTGQQQQQWQQQRQQQQQQQQQQKGFAARMTEGLLRCLSA
jgi:hypothetical protein